MYSWFLNAQPCLIGAREKLPLFFQWVNDCFLPLQKKGEQPTGQQRRKHQITYLIHQVRGLRALAC